MPGLFRGTGAGTEGGVLVTALDALFAAATRSSGDDSFYSCHACGGSMRKTLLGGLGPLACGSCGEIRWGK